MIRLADVRPTRRSVVRAATLTVLAAGTLVACNGKVEPPRQTVPVLTAGTLLTLHDTTVSLTFDASGVAEPLQQATVSTKLMGTVIAVRAHEGDRVGAGQVLIEIDARDLAAKANQVAASIADAEAMQQDAAMQVARIKALYADSAATRVQLDGAQTGLARADAGVRAARAGAAELDAMRSYAFVRAPFSGQVTMRMADVGTFAAPGAPLMTVQDASTLRVSVSAPADATKGLVRGRTLSAHVDGREVTATIEGVVPGEAGNLFTVNALVPNATGASRAGSAAVLHLPLGARQGLMVPLTALVRDGDLVGVMVRRNGSDDRRWIRIGATTTTHAEVTSGLAADEVIVVPVAAEPAAAAPAAIAPASVPPEPGR
jgi:RND family efflux transporter MFP subunit